MKELLFDFVEPDEAMHIRRQNKTIVHNRTRTENEVMNFKKWRKSQGVKLCQRCGKRLTNEKHHWLCNDCWNLKQLGITLNEGGE